MKTTIYSLAILIAVLTSCKKNSDSTPSTSAPTNSTSSVTIESSPRVTGKIDGTDYSKIVDNTSFANNSGAEKLIAALPDSSSGKYYSSITDISYSTTYFFVEKGTLKFQGIFPSNTLYKNFFSTGSCAYDLSSTQGIKISYYDNSGTEWSTDLGSGNQSGSSFTITDLKEINASNGYYVKIKASFNCKLYNGSGQSKNFTDGIFIGEFANA